MDDTLQWSKETEASLLSREAEANRESVIEEQPLSMICGLAIKAIQVDKPEEAERLLENIISVASRRLRGGAKLNNAEFISVCNVLVVMADAFKSPELISRLFSLHLATKRLMSRDLVERLYNLVRSVGYRACPELSRYLSFLNLNASSFSPSERFIHRRLQTLPKICS
jgi:urease gamma subunit